MAFQGSPLWGMQGLLIYSPSINAWEDKHATLSCTKVVRGMSAQSLEQYVEANATKRFTWNIYWSALEKGYAQSSLYSIQLQSFTWYTAASNERGLMSVYSLQCHPHSCEGDLVDLSTSGLACYLSWNLLYLRLICLN